jgi:toxin ParE1/3/4
MRIIWLQRARQDLDEAMSWLYERNPVAAQNASELIYMQIYQLKTYPQLGRIGQVHGTRELVIKQTRYIAPYRINFEANTIEILALMHDARLWPAAF